MKKNIKAILFDFDGVLANTMEDNFIAWKKAFKDKGVEIERDDYFPLEGLQLKHVAETIGNKYCIDKKYYEDVVRFKNKYYLDNHTFSFYEGVTELVDLLVKNNMKLAIVTASNKERLEKTVPENFLNKFEVIISGEDYVNGKPNPEPYLTAMKKLKISSEECIVVENAPLGVESAKSAGAYCVAITSTLEKKYLKEADEIIGKFLELLGILNV